MDERIKRYLYDLRTKYFEQLNDWEKEFVQNCSQRPELTVKQINRIKDMVAEVIEGKKPQQQGPGPFRQPEDRRIYAVQVAGGYRIAINKIEVGGLLSTKDAQLIASWLDTSLTGILNATALLPPKADSAPADQDLAPF